MRSPGYGDSGLCQWARYLVTVTTGSVSVVLTLVMITMMSTRSLTNYSNNRACLPDSHFWGHQTLSFSQVTLWEIGQISPGVTELEMSCSDLTEMCTYMYQNCSAINCHESNLLPGCLRQHRLAAIFAGSIQLPPPVGHWITYLLTARIFV